MLHDLVICISHIYLIIDLITKIDNFIIEVLWGKSQHGIHAILHLIYRSSDFGLNLAHMVKSRNFIQFITIDWVTLHTSLINLQHLIQNIQSLLKFLIDGGCVKSCHLFRFEVGLRLLFYFDHLLRIVNGFWTLRDYWRNSYFAERWWLITSPSCHSFVTLRVNFGKTWLCLGFNRLGFHIRRLFVNHS